MVAVAGLFTQGWRTLTLPPKTDRQRRMLELAGKGVSVQHIARRFNDKNVGRVRQFLVEQGVEVVEEVKYKRSRNRDI